MVPLPVRPFVSLVYARCVGQCESSACCRTEQNIVSECTELWHAEHISRVAVSYTSGMKSGTLRAYVWYEVGVRNVPASLSLHAIQHHEVRGSNRRILSCLMQVIFHVTIQNKKLEFPDTVPDSLRALGSACLNKDPAERPRFPEILKMLDEIDNSNGPGPESFGSLQ